MRRVEALVSILRESGCPHKVATWLAIKCRDCPFPGGHPEDVAGNLLRWRHEARSWESAMWHECVKATAQASLVYGRYSIQRPQIQREEPSQMKLWA